MLAIVSPAKSLDFDTKVDLERTPARLFGHSKKLLDELKEKSSQDLQELMGISENLGDLNAERFRKFSTKHTASNSKQAMYAFQGDVYQGLGAGTFTPDDVEFAQVHFRMLSGLYGLLRPLDAIQPYRLEMGTSLSVGEHSSLYGFWGDAITDQINKDLKAQGDNLLLNLASVEYFKSVNKQALKGQIIDVEFKDHKNGKYKIISFYAKKARGLMSRYIIKNRINDPNDLRGFDYEGYYFDEDSSNETFYAFKREEASK